VDGEVPGRSSDGDGGGGGHGGSGLVPGTTLRALVERDDDGCEAGGAGQRWQQRRRSGTMTVEEERDITVLERGGEGRVDGGDGVDLAAAMAWRWMGWWWQ
jgi:hypothetical protein